jgi:hypothetical protein
MQPKTVGEHGHNVEIELDSAGFGHIIIDGLKLKASWFCVNAGAGSPTELDIRVYVDKIKMNIKPTVLRVEVNPIGGPIEIAVTNQGV